MILGGHFPPSAVESGFASLVSGGRARTAYAAQETPMSEQATARVEPTHAYCPACSEESAIDREGRCL